MLTFPLPDATAFTVSDGTTEQVRHLLLGTPSGIQITIGQLHQLGYADPNDWSRPLPTGRPNEMMAILTKRVVC
jgi:hypothetical protein